LAKIENAKLLPPCAVPEIVGTAEGVGMMSMTELVAELAAGELDPPKFVATTDPTSAATGT
jgi:hypothetical protein